MVLILLLSGLKISFANKELIMFLLDCFIFIVHNRIYNSVAKYNSSRVGVGCMYVLFFYDWITFERFKLEG